MADSMPKSLAPLMILQVLWECSDPDHPMTQEQIRKELAVRGLELDRKAVHRHLEKLMEWDGVTINCDKRNGLESQVGTNFFINERPFTDADLRVMIDSLSANPSIDEKTTRELIDRVASLSSRHFKKKLLHLDFMTQRGKTENRELLDTVGQIEQAIAAGKKITYTGIRRDTDGQRIFSPRRVKVSPVQILFKDQKYYLLFIRKRNGETVLDTITLDRICNIEIEDEKAIDIHTLPEYKHGMDYDNLLREHPDLRRIKARTELCTFQCPPSCLDIIRAHFGTDLRVTPVTVTFHEELRSGEISPWEVDRLEVAVITDPDAAVDFAYRNPRKVWLIAPDGANRMLRQRLRAVAREYQRLENEYGYGLPAKVWQDRQNRDQNFSLADIKKKD